MHKTNAKTCHSQKSIKLQGKGREPTLNGSVEILQVKYLNNLIEQDHRFIRKITHPMMGFKAFHSAKATIGGIETAHMIRNGQLTEESLPAYQQFMALAG